VADLVELKSMSTPEEIKVWDDMAMAAQAEHVDNPSTMDIYNSDAVLHGCLQHSLNL
jgi:hypothetical protein